MLNILHSCNIKNVTLKSCRDGTIHRVEWGHCNQGIFVISCVQCVAANLNSCSRPMACVVRSFPLQTITPVAPYGNVFPTATDGRTGGHSEKVMTSSSSSSSSFPECDPSSALAHADLESKSNRPPLQYRLQCNTALAI